MVAANLKAETLGLMDKRSALEAEMNAIIERLTQPAALDFPATSSTSRDFIARVGLICRGFLARTLTSQLYEPNDVFLLVMFTYNVDKLKNDYKEITEKLDRNIQVLHSEKLAPKSSSLNPSDGQSGSVVSVGESASATNVNSNAMDVDVSVTFALVDEIADASPAAEDGFQLGDQIVKFGNVENGDNLLQKLASEAQTNQGCAIPVMVLRQGAQVNLMVTPRTWQGRGLLGYVSSHGPSFTSSHSCFVVIMIDHMLKFPTMLYGLGMP
ncbi:hypothetical protein ACLB2K_009159 [Fragaria x ananassa]